MTSKEKRERLLGDSRPFIRQFTKDDLWVMWAAYDMGSFPNLGKMDKEQFVGMLLELCKNKSSCLVVEDDCKWFKSGRGPVAFVAITNYGWRIEPHVDFFKWATPRIILRSNVAFFQMVRYSSQVGVCEIRSIEKHANLFEHLKKYGLVFPCGKIPNGDPRGDVFLYYAKGRKEHARADGNRNQLQRDDHGWSGESPGERRNGDLSKPDVQGLERGRSKGHAEPEHGSGGQREVHAEAIA
jgi:hypothetical protein